jgi:hypothetical protein
VVSKQRRTACAHEAGQSINQGRFPGTVWANEKVQSPLLKRQVDSVNRLEAVEVDGEVADLQVVLAEE